MPSQQMSRRTAISWRNLRLGFPVDDCRTVLLQQDTVVYQRRFYFHDVLQYEDTVSKPRRPLLNNERPPLVQLKQKIHSLGLQEH